ncbi:dihydrofolate synthase / folylpolyglutamate synthase [Alphaproteobacteria bacterium]
MVKMPHWPVPYGNKYVNFSLAAIQELLKALDNPNQRLPPVIHVAGTNGKGSTLAYLKAIFESAGYAAHRYTSPHLVRFNERITIAGQEIDDVLLYQLTEECRLVAQDLQVTFFEGTTAVALLAFSKFTADVVLLETGMGGRLDATNVIDHPQLTIITPIALDHTEYLGTTLRQIAIEKAGIIKRGCPCIISWQPEEAMYALIEKCEEMGAPYFAWGKKWHFEREGEGMKLRIILPANYNSDLISSSSHIAELHLPSPSLVGLHQFVNAATAAVAALHLSYLRYSKITLNCITEGITRAVWPARMQKITNGILYDMLPQEVELWLDGAHNVAGAEMLAASIRYMMSEKPLYLINGRTKKRDIKGFLQIFADLAKAVCCIEVKSEPLAEKAENIYKCAIELGFKAFLCDTLHEAVLRCLEDSGQVPCRILICGSLYLAGDVLAANQG